MAGPAERKISRLDQTQAFLSSARVVELEWTEFMGTLPAKVVEMAADLTALSSLRRQEDAAKRAGVLALGEPEILPAAS